MKHLCFCHWFPLFIFLLSFPYSCVSIFPLILTNFSFTRVLVSYHFSPIIFFPFLSTKHIKSLLNLYPLCSTIYHQHSLCSYLFLLQTCQVIIELVASKAILYVSLFHILLSNWILKLLGPIWKLRGFESLSTHLILTSHIITYFISYFNLSYFKFVITIHNLSQLISTQLNIT